MVHDKRITQYISNVCTVYGVPMFVFKKIYFYLLSIPNISYTFNITYNINTKIGIFIFILISA